MFLGVHLEEELENTPRNGLCISSLPDLQEPYFLPQEKLIPVKWPTAQQPLDWKCSSSSRPPWSPGILKLTVLTGRGAQQDLLPYSSFPFGSFQTRPKHRAGEASLKLSGWDLTSALCPLAT